MGHTLSYTLLTLSFPRHSGLMAASSEYKDGKCTVPTQNVTEQGQVYVALSRWTTLEDKYVLAGPSFIDLSAQNVTVTYPAPGAASNSSAASSSAAPAASMASSVVSSAAASATA